MAYLTGNTSLNTAEAQVAFGAVTISNAHRVAHRDVLLCLAGLEPASPPTPWPEKPMNQVPTLTARVAAPPDTATPAYRPIPPYCVPEPFGEHLLALHYRLLRDVRPQVRDGGGVLTAIGGRVPDAVAFGLHRVCGYVPEFVAYDVKLQSEARLIVPGYRQVEERHSGVQFRFYAAEAVPLVADAKRSGLEGQALADAVAPALRNLTLAARDADRHWRQGCQSPTRF